SVVPRVHISHRYKKNRHSGETRKESNFSEKRKPMAKILRIHRFNSYQTRAMVRLLYPTWTLNSFPVFTTVLKPL
ncbi:hypothetical protein SK128_018945, partial [Halocaridina rubra]